jgi:hypothetical protein
VADAEAIDRRLPMSWSDRAVRRARQHLADDEGIVATALGIEADGRRRQLVLLTDRRLLVAGLRSTPPHAMDPDATRGAFDPTGDLLSLREGDDEILLRAVERTAAQRLLVLLEQRRPAGSPASDVPSTVRIVT